jgi:hypothetical protein
VRAILVVLYLVAAAATLLFAVLALIYIALAGWALWERQVGAFLALSGLGALTGYFALRVLIGLRDSFTGWRRQCQADRDLPRARIVPRGSR